MKQAITDIDLARLVCILATRSPFLNPEVDRISGVRRPTMVVLNSISYRVYSWYT